MINLPTDDNAGMDAILRDYQHFKKVFEIFMSGDLAKVLNPDNPEHGTELDRVHNELMALTSEERMGTVMFIAILPVMGNQMIECLKMTELEAKVKNLTEKIKTEGTSTETIKDLTDILSRRL